MTQPLIKHLERYLGSIEEGWSKRCDGAKMPFQIVRYGGSTDEFIYSTLGLSEFALVSRNSGKKIRCELLVTCRQADANVVGALQNLGTALATSGQALLRGDVVEFSEPLVGGSSLKAWYSTIPVYFPDDFSSCNAGHAEPVVIVWLIPIAPDEAQFVRGNGWAEFERKLEKTNPDLGNLNRVSVLI